VTFVHDDPEFDALLGIVATGRRMALGIVEKDYWVTHTLWALHAAGFDVWFKGGTSLSKGFSLIERFSEDLDLKVERGTVDALPDVSNWRSEGSGATSERQAYFEKLPSLLVVPGAQVSLDRDAIDRSWRGANLRVTYPGRHLADLGVMAPFVRLEVGSARVTPFVQRDMTSFVHDELSRLDQLGDFDDNRPRAVRCVHPLVTLLEKLDAIHRRFPNEKCEAATFVRHFEDAARIIAGVADLPPLKGHADVRALADDMLGQKPRQLDVRPSARDPGFAPVASTRWDEIRAAYEAIAQMFWGPRVPLDEACAGIREWSEKTFG
jgi:hypothetical protein